MGWGTNAQRAHLLTKLLSEEIKTKIDDVSESYSKTKAHLIADRIFSDILVGLITKRHSYPGNKKEKYQFYVELTKAISRLDKLC